MATESLSKEAFEDKYNCKITVTNTNDEQFLWGLLSALNILHTHDSAVAANDIVNAYTTIKELEKVAINLGGDLELDTISWLKKYHKS